LDASERTRIAKYISVVATGTKEKPCYSIIDKGEGQTPEKMPLTLLSISKSNKLRIPFVQGKFNMGGTGALPFCGKNRLQLIISKRHPEVFKFENNNSENMWGFTIVRKDNAMGLRSSVYRYLAPNNKVLSFKSDGLPLVPGDYPDPYERILEWGTFIKLYEYEMTGYKTNIQFDLYNRLSLLIPNVALPIRLYERRKGYTGHTFETTLSGLTVRLDEDKRENLEEGFPTSSPLCVQGQKMNASIFAFKPGQSEKYSKNEGIVFINNGQTHGHFTRSFFSRKAVGMNFLADSILVLIDCSDLSLGAIEDLFMNSRDRLRTSELSYQIEDELTDLLKNHSGLRALRERRIKEEIEGKLSDAKPLANVLNDIISKSPTLSKLFVQGVRLPSPFKLQESKPQEKFIGRKFPTFFRLVKDFPKNMPKDCPKNMRVRIQFKTDAMNDYLVRDIDPGTFKLKLNEMEYKNTSMNLWNGTATLNIGVTDDQINEVLHFTTEISDVNRPEPIIDEFYLKISDPTIRREDQHQSIKKRKLPPSDDDGNGSQKKSYLDIPNVREVRRGEWEERHFDERTAMEVKDTGGQGYIFYVNMDNIHLLTELKASKNGDYKLTEARYKYGLVLIGLGLLQNAKDTQNEKLQFTEDMFEENDIYKEIGKITRSISPILLPMISGLGTMTFDENN